MEFISSLLGGTDTPDAPLDMAATEMTALAEAVPLDARAASSAAARRGADGADGADGSSRGAALLEAFEKGPYARERAFLSVETADVMKEIGPILGGHAGSERGGASTHGGARGLGGALRGRSPGASVAEALRRRARDIEEAERRDHSRLANARHDHRVCGSNHDPRSRLRVHSAPEPSAGPALSRLFENTETHLPAAAVRRSAERREMQLRNAQQAQQARTTRGDAEDGGSAGPSSAKGTAPNVAGDASGRVAGPVAAAPPEAEAAKNPESTAIAKDPGIGPDPVSTGLAPTVQSKLEPVAAPSPAATPSPPPGARQTPSSLAAKPKTKNPKRADRRRTIARFTTAILRAGGSNAFIARDGLGYRKAFDRFLVETYGETFAEGGYWYENARVEPFFRVLFHVATDGRVRVDHDAVNALFCKREKRQAAEWLLDEEELSKFGVTATQLAQIFEGPPSVSPTGYPRGTPLAIPTDAELDSGALPRKGGGAAAAAAAAAAQQQQMMRHAPGLVSPEFGAPHPGNSRSIPVAVAVRAEDRGGKEGSPGDAMGPPGERGAPHGLPGPGGSGGPGGPPGLGGGRPYDAAMAAAAAVAAAGGPASGYSHAQIQYAQALARQQAHHQPHQGAPPRDVSGLGSDASGQHPLSGHAPGYYPHAPPGFPHTAHPGFAYNPPPLSMFPPVSLNAGAYGPPASAGAPGAGAAPAGPVPVPGPLDGSFGPHGRVPSFGYLDPVGSGPRRQYSSDLSRLMSEFNANPTTSDDFLKSFIQRSASELDILASLQSGPANPKPS